VWRPLSVVLIAVLAGVGMQACLRSDPPSSSAIVTYNVPPGQARGTNFAVAVRTPNGSWRPLESYLAYVNYYNPTPASMVEFDARGPVQVAVTARSGTIRTADVRPAALNIEPTISPDGRTATFTLPHPMNVSFDANGDTTRNLQVFVNQLQVAPARSTTRHIISFGPGVHVIPGDHVLRVPGDTTVEIAGGSVVVGALSITGSHVTVEGHGVIDPAPAFSSGNSPPTVSVGGTSDVGIRDITILESAAEGFEIRDSSDVVISHVREINSVRYSDGIDVTASHNVLIEDSFLRTSDDSVAVYASTPWGAHGSTSDVTVRDCTLYPDVAHPVLIGTHGNPSGHDTIEHLLFNDLDTLDEDVSQPLYQGVLAINAGNHNTVSDVQFENVDVERILDGQMFNIRVFLNPSYNTQPGDSVSHVFFRDVTYPADRGSPSPVEGYSPTRTVSGVTFENVRRGGRLVLGPGEGNIHIGPYATAIGFRAAAPARSVDDRSWRYSGAWKVIRATDYFGGTAHVGSSAGSTASFTFQGTQARLFGTDSPLGGIATVQVDNGSPVTIDTYDADTANQQLWFDTGPLPAGRHTIRIRATGRHDHLSGAAVVTLDRLDVVSLGR
jgi:hypothetical protein